MSGRRARGQHSGFALLLVFLMAACIAIALYRELPRVAFEAQREKEQLLISRGEQYKRAIQVFVRKTNRYPATLDELESYQNQRFLRKRYVDPMTGKDKWRLIHVGPGGVLTDSINNKQKPGQGPPGAQDKKEANTFIYEATPLGATNPQDNQQSNPAKRRRASDSQNLPGMTSGAPGGTLNPDGTVQVGTAGVAQVPGVPGQAPYPGQPAYPGQQYPGQQYPGQQYPGAQPNQPYPGTQGYPAPQGYPGSQAYPGMQARSGMPSIPGTQVNPGMQGYPGQMGTPQTGMQGYPGMGMNAQAGAAYPYSNQPAMQGAPAGFPGAGAQTGQNQAVQLIQQILTSPRPGGMPGTQPGMGGMQIGGGIAGVASTDEEESIIVYNEKQKYNEWEFIYDLTKDRTLAGGGRPGTGTVGTPASQMGQIPGQQPGAQPGAFGQSSFGQSSFGQSGFGQSGFGQSSFGKSGSPQPAFGQSGFGQSQPQPQQQQPPVPPPQNYYPPGYGQQPQMPPTQVPPQAPPGQLQPVPIPPDQAPNATPGQPQNPPPQTTPKP